MTDKVMYLADTTSRLPSSFWNGCPWDEIGRDYTVGCRFEDDLITCTPCIAQTTELSSGQYKWFNTGSGVWTTAPTVNSVVVRGGILQNTLDTDNDSGSMGVTTRSFRKSGSASTSNKLWFEARIAYSPITTNGLGWFIGLAETNLWTFATAVPMNAGDAITNTAAAIGFRKPEDDTTTFDTVYTDRATSFTAIGDGEGTYATAYVFTKLGFKYDPSDATNTVTFYQDGAALSTKLSAATLAAMTYLDAGLLSPMISNIADSSGTSSAFFIDWWRCAQVY